MAPDVIEALGKQPWRFVCGSVVFGLGLADWDTDENKTTPTQLSNIMRTVIEQSTSPLVTFAWLCSDQQYLEFMPVVKSTCNCGADYFMCIYNDAYQVPGTFYANA